MQSFKSSLSCFLTCGITQFHNIFITFCALIFLVSRNIRLLAVLTELEMVVGFMFSLFNYSAKYGGSYLSTLYRNQA